MTRQKKTIIALLATVFIACAFCAGLGVWFISLFSGVYTTDPARITAIGAGIADFTLPPGYAGVSGLELAEIKFITLAGDATGTASTVISLGNAATLDRAQGGTLEEQLQTYARLEAALLGINFTLDRLETRTINGQDVTLTYRQGADAAGNSYRQVTGIFNSRHGTGFILARGLESGWDQETFNSLLDSLR